MTPAKIANSPSIPAILLTPDISLASTKPYLSNPSLTPELIESIQKVVSEARNRVGKQQGGSEDPSLKVCLNQVYVVTYSSDNLHRSTLILVSTGCGVFQQPRLFSCTSMTNMGSLIHFLLNLSTLKQTIVSLSHTGKHLSLSTLFGYPHIFSVLV
jgi:hypothetical protein